MRLACYLLLTGVLTGHADTILTTAGKTNPGRVLTYASGTFEVEDDQRKSQRIAAASLKSIEFDGEGTPGVFELRTQSQVKGRVTRYENGAFHLKDEKGIASTVTASMVTRASFGGGSSKPVEQVTGGDLEKYLAPGKVTIVDFYADWCGPCRRLGPLLENFAKKDDGVVLRKVNVDRNKELAQQYRVRSIPHVVVFDGTGRNVGNLTGPSLDSVKQLVTKAKGKTS